MLEELLAHEQVTETCVLRSRVGFMALHGGIEEGTAELATRAAARAGASLYTVVVGDGLWWHVPSIHFDPEQSLQLAEFLDHVEVVLSLHGYGRKDLKATVLLGGAHRSLARAVAHQLRAHTELSVMSDIADIPPGLRGLHPANPVNLATHGGVQIELPPSARNGAVAAGVTKALIAAAFSVGG